MRARAAAALAVGAIVVGGATTAAAMSYDDTDRWHPGAGMMSGPAWADGRGDGDWDGGHHMGVMQHAWVDGEYGYLAEMVAHHEEAIAMARELARSDRPEMRAFGEQVVESQSAQVEQMRAWLERWYPSRSGEVDYDPMMRDLTELSGDDLDRTFLQDMVGHHMAAIMMSQQLLVHGLVTHRPVAALADDIRDEQRAEVHQMLRWLDEWFD
jgi:uncharacterized protein (DUF305 family)